MLAWGLDELLGRSFKWQAVSRFERLRHHSFFDLIIFALIVFNFFLDWINPLMILIDGGMYKNVEFITGFWSLILPLSMYRCLYLFYFSKDMLSKVLIFFYIIFFISLVSRIVAFTIITVIIISWIGRKMTQLKLYQKLKKISVLSLFFLVLMLVFGGLGEFRSKESREYARAESRSTTVIEYLASPSDNFEKTGLNPNILWPYIYMVSPLYNLDSAISSFSRPDDHRLLRSILPNFISERILSLKKDKSSLVFNHFNTSTTYGGVILASGPLVGVLYHFGLVLFVLCLGLLIKKYSFPAIGQFLVVFVILTVFSEVL